MYDVVTTVCRGRHSTVCSTTFCNLCEPSFLKYVENNTKKLQKSDRIGYDTILRGSYPKGRGYLKVEPPAKNAVATCSKIVSPMLPPGEC